MPYQTQKSVSIPKWLWNQVNKYFKEHEEELRMEGVNSASALIAYWVREGLKEVES